MDLSNIGVAILIVIGVLAVAEIPAWLLVWMRYPDYRQRDFHPRSRTSQQSGHLKNRSASS